MENKEKEILRLNDLVQETLGYISDKYGIRIQTKIPNEGYVMNIIKDNISEELFDFSIVTTNYKWYSKGELNGNISSDSSFVKSAKITGPSFDEHDFNHHDTYRIRLTRASKSDISDLLATKRPINKWSLQITKSDILVENPFPTFDMDGYDSSILYALKAKFDYPSQDINFAMCYYRDGNHAVWPENIKKLKLIIPRNLTSIEYIKRLVDFKPIDQFSYSKLFNIGHIKKAVKHLTEEEGKHVLNSFYGLGVTKDITPEQITNLADTYCPGFYGPAAKEEGGCRRMRFLKAVQGYAGFGNNDYLNPVKKKLEDVVFKL